LLKQSAMPIYEYRCRSCLLLFDRLIRGSETPACPTCGGQDLERLLSSFAVSSDGRSHANLHAARRQFTNSTERRDLIRQEQEEVREHVQEDCGIRVPEPSD
jgi:putative FmdB family regulatory protein